MVLQRDTFYRAGINPASMDSTISGDRLFEAHNKYGSFYGVFDGAWAPGYEWYENGDHKSLQPKESIDGWSSRAAYLGAYTAVTRRSVNNLNALLEHTSEFYAKEVFQLKASCRHYAGLAARSYEPVMNVHTPQCTGVIAFFRNNGLIDICQWGDCFAAVEKKDGRIEMLTPDQVESVSQAFRTGDPRYEVLGHNYQAFVKAALESGKTYGDIRNDVHHMAIPHHGPTFFANNWKAVDSFLDDSLTGPNGFQIWREAMSGVCKSCNFSNFVNKPNNPIITADTGESIIGSWGMLTGDKNLLKLATHKTIHSDDINSLYLGSDGMLGPNKFFENGQRISAVRKIHTLGAEGYYEHMLTDMFTDNKILDSKNKDTKKGIRYSDTTIPMDTSLMRVYYA